MNKPDVLSVVLEQTNGVINEVRRSALVLAVSLLGLGLSGEIGGKLGSLSAERVEVLYKRLEKLLEGKPYLETTFGDEGKTARVVAYSEEPDLIRDKNGELDWAHAWEMNCNKVPGTNKYQLVNLEAENEGRRLTIQRTGENGEILEVTSTFAGELPIVASYEKNEDGIYRFVEVKQVTSAGSEVMTAVSGENTKGIAMFLNSGVFVEVATNPKNIFYTFNNLDGFILEQPNSREGLLSKQIQRLFNLVGKVERG